ncbi:8999_t:CDS:2 [Rhizophagus irregularis]|nr:8999_t:CDS:2 [Rhizophagus irregularis]
MSDLSDSEIFQPFIDLFTQSQVNSILLAWLPVKFGSYMTGIMTVDMFLTSIIASGISTLALALYNRIITSSTKSDDPIRSDNIITIQIEYYTEGTYGDLTVSVIYKALSWLISQQTKCLDKGSFIVRHTDSVNRNNDDECAPPGFDILPEKNQKIMIEYKGLKFDVTYKSSTSIDIITDYLNEITRSYLETQKKVKVRSRYERNGHYWYRVQTLSCVRNLDSVALDESQEILLKKELDTFINDKAFYDRIGIPYRRGILLYGSPGTGKTSLINAISSHLSRDTYYLNLKGISNDNQLSAAFSSVPANQIIVLEDVDTQSTVLHKRTRKKLFFSVTKSTSIDKKDTEQDDQDVPTGPSFSGFSLSTFLGCLDGNILAEGNIIVMTTNHVEHLDPACIRPGRMDVHLNLGYCTCYQINKMYKIISENPKVEFPEYIIEKIPERLLPPCEVMMTMVLYRNDIHLIPEKVYELVIKYKDMSPEEIAKQIEEEALREAQRISEKIEETEEEAKDESQEKKEEVEEVEDENKDKEKVVEDESEKEVDVEDENKEKEKVKEEFKDNNKDEKEEVKYENTEKKEDVKEDVEDENKDKEKAVKDESKEKKNDIEDENKEKEKVKEEFEDDNKDEKEVKYENTEKKKDVKEDVKDGNKDNEEKIKNENENKNKIESNKDAKEE